MAGKQDGTGTQLQAEREGFARALAKKLYGSMNPDVVQFFYDWEIQSSHHGGTYLDPYNFRHGGHYKNRGQAVDATAKELHSHRFQELTKDLGGGFDSQGRLWMDQHGMHLSHAKLPLSLDAQGGLKSKPGNWADKVPSGISDTLSSVDQTLQGKGLGGLLGGISMTMVVVVVLIIIVIGKK